ncbi:hypothetical protein A3B18_02045 [Candidatus Giovannonibacteria bacterium RIFCSPLOWO2_01_FULL_46_13]|uniref:Uncharacterized protein n=1 Tax=Candidatus Giovannonibacteria bacterium RIFCSPLOWO2_01_FULL_46_13 TaxID=1798352 RepID=A0A1F5X5Y3_9BACT|nr:MAG: hypothetical protein A3B18_02045 [Candidatus Giovannonibacteria bacterium RIFCSPLOWO2_01_FULL_46_13]
MKVALAYARVEEAREATKERIKAFPGFKPQLSFIWYKVGNTDYEFCTDYKKNQTYFTGNHRLTMGRDWDRQK